MPAAVAGSAAEVMRGRGSSGPGGPGGAGGPREGERGNAAGALLAHTALDPSANGPRGRACPHPVGPLVRSGLSPSAPSGLSGTGSFRHLLPMQKVSLPEGTWWSLVLAQLFHRSQKTADFVLQPYSPIIPFPVLIWECNLNWQLEPVGATLWFEVALWAFA